MTTDNTEQRAERGEAFDPQVRARTLLAYLWRKYDAGGESMGRSHAAVLLETAMDLLGPADQCELVADYGDQVNEARQWLSTKRAAELGFDDARAALAQPPRAETCKWCGGTGIDGDVDDRGATIDVPCICTKPRAETLPELPPLAESMMRFFDHYADDSAAREWLEGYILDYATDYARSALALAGAAGEKEGWK